jgi:hypothetical protein
MAKKQTLEKPFGSAAFTKEITREPEHAPESEPPQKTDALQKTGPEMDYAFVGKALIERARQNQQEQFQNEIVATVQIILRDIAVQQQAIDFAKERIVKQEARLAALQAGEFKIDVVSATVQFDDKTLQSDDLSSRTVLYRPNLSGGR